MIPTLFFVALIVFVLAHAAPGSPFDKNENRPLPEQTILRLNRLYGIDRPIYEQFALYLNNLVHLDLGSSLVKDRTIGDIISQEFPVSAQLGVQALLIALAVSIPLGVVSALKQNSGVDYFSLVFATVGYTVPGFVIAIFAIYIFGVGLKWLPFVGWGNGCGPLASCDVKRMLLPTVILSLGATAFLTRITRASMLEAIRQDYTRTARAKGVSETVIMARHALRNALIPVITILGPLVIGIITGSVVIENLFGIPGLGKEFAQSILNRDYFIVIGVFTMYAAMVGVANLTVDLMYVVIDPRIRY